MIESFCIWSDDGRAMCGWIVKFEFDATSENVNEKHKIRARVIPGHKSLQFRKFTTHVIIMIIICSFRMQ